MKRLMIGVISVLLLVFGSGIAGAQNPNNEACAQRGGDWDQEQNRCMMRSSFSMEVAYPLGYDAYPLVAAEIEGFVESVRAEFLGSMLLSGGLTQPGPGGWQLSVAYDEYRVSDTIVSFKFDIYQYTGGASGFGTFETFIFDLAADRELSLDELFVPGTDYLSVIAPLARQSIAMQYNVPVDDSWLVEGSAPVTTNYQHVVLTPTELLILFDEYQVGPGAMGGVVARVPLAELRGILAVGIVP